MEVRCLLNSVQKNNIQNGVARCNKTFNTLSTKAGEIINEVICDYGKGVITKSEVYPNKIINSLANGDIVTYTKNALGNVLIQENGIIKTTKNPNLWQNLLTNIFKGIN